MSLIPFICLNPWFPCDDVVFMYQEPCVSLRFPTLQDVVPYFLEAGIGKEVDGVIIFEWIYGNHVLVRRSSWKVHGNEVSIG